MQVGLALQATDMTVATERKAAVEVSPEAAATFSAFWQAHAGCPLQGRNKVRMGVFVGRCIRCRSAAGVAEDGAGAHAATLGTGPFRSRCHQTSTRIVASLHASKLHSIVSLVPPVLLLTARSPRGYLHTDRGQRVPRAARSV